MRGEAERLGHVKLGGAGHLPVEVEEEAGKRELHVGERKAHARAHPPLGPERQELEVGAPEVRRAVGGGFEPLRPERVGVPWPVALVAAQRPGVHHHRDALRHVVAQHAAGVLALLRDQERQRRVQPEHLLDDEGQVLEPLLHELLLPHRPVRGEGVPHLRCCPLHDLRVLDELRHGPLQRRRCRLAAGKDVLQAIIRSIDH